MKADTSLTQTVEIKLDVQPSSLNAVVKGISNFFVLITLTSSKFNYLYFGRWKYEGSW